VAVCKNVVSDEPAGERSACEQTNEEPAMKATDILMDEHRVIEQVLTCLEKLADRCEATEVIDRASALKALAFFRNFADRCHHGKEEGHLFPLLEARGFVRQSGPTGVMLHEHEEGRSLLAAMASAVEQDAPREFARQARAYVGLLREHIHKEDQCLFPMAAAVLSGADAEALAQRFEHVEDSEMGEGTHEHYLQLANDLADRLAVNRARVAAVCGHTCGHHRRA
jgi:hemerythrin-like domain-containing protein